MHLAALPEEEKDVCITPGIPLESVHAECELRLNK
jgi:hypothetical protein